jgi:sugar (pentulose or hexulose) kinase
VPLFLAIDNGSQSTKALIVDELGEVHASARVGLLPYETGRPGRAVHPGDDVWRSIVSACRRVLERFTGDIGQLAGVGLCTIRYCRALLDDDGLLAQPMLSWMDDRVGRPYRDTEQVAWVTTSSGYVAHRLTGRFVDAAGNYQGVWPIDQATWRWSGSEEAYTSAGMRRSLLFELVDPGGWLGDVTAEASHATGLPAGIPVFATSNDKAVEALGAGLTEESQLLLSLGTYISSMMPIVSSGGGAAHWVNFASQPHRYLAESRGIRRGMWTVSWFRSLLEGGAAAGDGALSGPPGGAAGGDHMYDLDARLSREAEKVAFGSDGVTAVLDWLAPPDAPYRRGALIGFSGDQGRAHIYRAILEGIAFTMADNADAMTAELGRDVHSVVVTGGGARSALMSQIVSDCFGVPVARAAHDDAAAIGAAMCAALGTGFYADWRDATDAMARQRHAASPRPEAVVAGRRLRERHRGVRERVAELSRWSEQVR